MVAKTVFSTVPESQADVALAGIPLICAMLQMSRSQWDEMVRTKIAPQPVIRRPRFVRWLLGDVRQFLVEFTANGGNDDAAVNDRKAVDAAKVAAVQAKRDATRTANKKAKVDALAAARLARHGTALASRAAGSDAVAGDAK